jgi:hypothetical protein
LRGDVGAGQLAQQLLLAFGHIEAARDQRIQRGEIALQAIDRRRHRSQRLRRDGAALQLARQLIEPPDLRRDGLGGLLVLRPRGRGEERRRRGHDPLGLARQFEGRERRGHPLLGDAPEHLADLGEGIHGGRCRDHRERADAEKREQQASAHTQALQKRLCASRQAL